MWTLCSLHTIIQPSFTHWIAQSLIRKSVLQSRCLRLHVQVLFMLLFFLMPVSCSMVYTNAFFHEMRHNVASPLLLSPSVRLLTDVIPADVELPQHGDCGYYDKRWSIERVHTCTSDQLTHTSYFHCLKFTLTKVKVYVNSEGSIERCNRLNTCRSADYSKSLIGVNVDGFSCPS